VCESVDIHVELERLTSIRRNYSAFFNGIIPSNPLVFGGAASRNTENCGHASGYGEKMRIKAEHLSKRIRSKRWQARKSPLIGSAYALAGNPRDEVKNERRIAD